MTILEVKGISKSLQQNLVVNNISFSQQKNQKLAIAGETGSGKSTLLKMICGWVQPEFGTIYFNGKRVLGPEEQLLPGQPDIAYLSQHFELRNNYRVDEILEMAQQLDDVETAAIFEVCRIEHLLKRRTDQLSGGEKQRIAAARLLIGMPKLLLLDEPYSNLDTVHKNMLKEVIRDIGERLNITCLLISHDPADVLSWAEEIIVMKEGKIVQHDTPQIVYRQPHDEYTAGLFGKFNIVSLDLATLLVPFTGRSLASLPLFLRPEDFELSTRPGEGLAGTVIQSLYYGNSTDVDVMIGTDVLTIKVPRHELTAGDQVFVRLA